ncbi:MAG: hypothetical protein A3F74_19290 [Betaproteobacteria bacterium RIFCSPLOWO2_12_FULL_62_58]|nr:MAG: hypothetical protein A3F74_19290 [Betaproteobacteria bacterium RIFCSPLOWO2_12_FULL_62_58]
MKTLFKSWIFRALALTMVASAAFAQDRGPFQREELDQMLAPVALYPDALLSQILMASTYPLEVVQASRWSRTNPTLKGQNAVRAVERMDWDPSVKSLTAFPQILHMMDEKLEWTERLGEAFLAQQADVMDTVQDLRRRAEAAGNLSSGDQMQVRREGEFIMIEPPAPEVVYVPYYDPAVVYGPWWWPEYPPVYWAPPWAYYVVPPYPSLFLWGSGIGVSANFFFGYPDWRRRHVSVVHRHVTVGNRRTPSVNRGAGPREPVVWRHNPDHRRGVPFRHAEARQRFEQERAAAGTTRRGPDRNDVAPTIRRADDIRPAYVGQRRLEERPNPVQQQRESAVGRVTLDNDGNRAARAPVNRNDERARPAAQPAARAAKPETRTARPDTRGSQAETRNPQPDTRGAQSDSRNAPPDSRAAPPERSTPQSGDRRGERRGTQRPLARNDPPQPLPVAPVVRSGPRSARSEPRPDMRPIAPTANSPAAPPRPPAFDNGRRAEARGGVERGRQQDVVRERAPAPRAAANVPNPAPRTENSQQRGGGARDQGDGNPRGRSVNRDNNRS